MTEDHKILSRKLLQMFPDKNLRSKVESILTVYGAEAYEKEADRVRLAILKLASSDFDKISHYTGVAKQDYRDVLAWAEYPRQSKHWSVPAGEKKDRMVKADRDEYETWLAK